MLQYRKKPVVIEAIQWDGKNFHEILDFAPKKVNWEVNTSKNINFLEVSTLEGILQASVGDYIIKGVKGEFYPIKEEIFNLTYDAILG